MTARLSTADLLGGWRLVSWEVESEGAVRRPFGDHPTGLLCYTFDGWMSACIASAERPALSAGSPRQSSAEEQAAAFTTYFTYAGRYDVVGEDVVHHVEVALNPAMVGTDQVRRVALDGDTLMLSAGEPVSDGAVRSHRLTWQRP